MNTKMLHRAIKLILFFSLIVQTLYATNSKETPYTVSSDSIFKEYLVQQGFKITSGNEITLLTSGKEKFNFLFQDIDNAKHHIHLEYFNFRNDSIGKEIFTHLVYKAKEGVQVRVIFDDFGNFSNNQPLKKSHIKDLRKNGIDIIRFDPFKFPYINHAIHRDHQKIAVIDGKVGYTGGMNVADYYLNGLPEIGEWRDMHVRITGPAVNELQKAFLYNWNRESKRPPSNLPSTPEDSTENPVNQGEKQVAILQRIPRKRAKAIRHAYIAAINAAQNNIQIINPYFVPPRSIIKALKRALKRGVKVEIIYPNKSDIPITPHAGYYYINKLRKVGAETYLFKKGFHHSKIMMIDYSFCTIGSCNLDSRSMRFDYEINAFIFDPVTTRKLNMIFEEDKKNSIPHTQEYHDSLPPRKKIAAWFTHLLRPVL